ncbi:hypothetical protein ACFPM0_17020 [Pseudonocardia sulfidoxydans]
MSGDGRWSDHRHSRATRGRPSRPSLPPRSAPRATPDRRITPTVSVTGG